MSINPELPRRLVSPWTLVAGLGLILPGLSQAHFQELIPSTEVLTAETGPELSLDLAFTHPMERGPVMAMGEPVRFGVIGPEGRVDLSERLEMVERDGKTAYQTDYRASGPGDHVFFVEPAPYWEPAEDAFIVHYTKTYVTAYGDDEGWDRELGLKTEIVPLSKPFGLWEHNVFQGIVKMDGEPVPFAEVEVEFYNQTAGATAPDELMITQTVKADANGVFTYAPPAAGWWGFAALNTADYTLPQDGEEKAVELGAVIWVHFEPWTGQ